MAVLFGREHLGEVREIVLRLRLGLLELALTPGVPVDIKNRDELLGELDVLEQHLRLGNHLPEIISNIQTVRALVTEYIDERLESAYIG